MMDRYFFHKVKVCKSHSSKNRKKLNSKQMVI